MPYIPYKKEIKPSAKEIIFLKSKDTGQDRKKYNFLIYIAVLYTRVSPTGVLQSDVVAKLKIDEF